MQRHKGKSNAQNLFDMVKIPTDTHIKALLDPIDEGCLGSVFRHTVSELKQAGQLKDYEVMSGHYLLALDGTDYFSSQKIHCQNGTTAIASYRLC
jgi:hypothetical protein